MKKLSVSTRYEACLCMSILPSELLEATSLLHEIRTAAKSVNSRDEVVVFERLDITILILLLYPLP
jgi:hypothetical protein